MVYVHAQKNPEAFYASGRFGPLWKTKARLGTELKALPSERLVPMDSRSFCMSSAIMSDAALF